MTPKIVSIPPPIPKEDITKEGIQVKIAEARIARNIYTSLGEVKKALVLTIRLNNEYYSHLFSLDKEPVSGSVGRILVSIGIDDTDDPQFDAKLKKLVNKTVKVAKKADKLYWYP